jgi:hypothetical protein
MDGGWGGFLWLILPERGGVSYDPPRDALWAYDEYLTVFPRAQRYVPAVVDAIQRGDSLRLARLFTPDDVDYPPALAARVIRTYRGRFDVGTIRWHFVGLGPERANAGPPAADRRLRYLLTGTRDGRPVEHAVAIGYGDGLIWWDDEWAPDPPAS